MASAMRQMESKSSAKSVGRHCKDMVAAYAHADLGRWATGLIARYDLGPLWPPL